MCHRIRLLLVFLALSFVGASNASAETRPYLYVANHGSDTVSVIDTTTHSVVDTIAIGDGIRPRGIAVSRDGATLYVLADTLWIIDARTRQVRATLPASGEGIAEGMDISFDERWCAAWDRRGTVSISDTKTGSRVDVQVGDTYLTNGNTSGFTRVSWQTNGLLRVEGLHGVATIDPQTGQMFELGQDDVEDSQSTLVDHSRFVTPDGRFTYFASSPAVRVVETARQFVYANIGLAGDWRRIDPTPDARFAYLSGVGGRIAVVDLATNITIAELQLPTQGDAPFLAMQSDGRVLYATTSAGVFAIDVNTNRATTLLTAAGPTGIAVSPDGTTALVVNLIAGSVTAIDTTESGVRAVIPLERRRTDVTFTRTGQRAYISGWRRGIEVIDPLRATIAEHIDSTYSESVALSPDGKVLMGSYYGDDVVFTDAITGVELEYHSLACGGDYGIGRMAFSPDGTRAYVANTDCREINVFALDDFSQVKAIYGGDSPTDIAIAPTGDRLYVVDAGYNTMDDVSGNFRRSLITVDLQTGAPLNELRLPDAVSDLVVVPDSPLVYVLQQWGDSVVAIDPIAGTFGEPIPVGLNPQRAAFARVERREPSDPPVVIPPAIIEPVRIRIEPTIWPTRTPTSAAAPSHTPTATPTASPTPDCNPKSDCIWLEGQTVVGRPGETVSFSIRLRSEGHLVAGIQNELISPDALPFATPGSGVSGRVRPDCRVNSAIEKDGWFDFPRFGCLPGDCNVVRTLVLSLSDMEPIADGAVLYTCRVPIPLTAAPGSYAIRIENAGGSTPDGDGLDVGTIDTIIRVEPDHHGSSDRSLSASYWSGSANDGGCAIAASDSHDTGWLILTIGLAIAVSRHQRRTRV